MKRGGFLMVADGFTIIEVLIVLAVSGLLLLSAILLISGRQARTEFTTGINQMQQQIQQTINETASGFYPSRQDFTCYGSATGPVTFSQLLASGVGTNQGCIFLGNAIQFGVGPTTPDNSTLGVMPLTGNQYIGGTYNPVLTVSDTIPRAAYPASPAEIGVVPNTTLSSLVMDYSLTIPTANGACGTSTTGACYVPATDPPASPTYVPAGMAAFVAGDSSGNIAANASGSSTNLQSGIEQLTLYGVTSSVVDTPPVQASASLGSVTRSSGPGNLVAASEVLFCVASAATNQSALFTIGGTGGLSVSFKVIANSTTC